MTWHGAAERCLEQHQHGDGNEPCPSVLAWLLSVLAKVLMDVVAEPLPWCHSLYPDFEPGSAGVGPLGLLMGTFFCMKSSSI